MSTYLSDSGWLVCFSLNIQMKIFPLRYPINPVLTVFIFVFIFMNRGNRSLFLGCSQRIFLAEYLNQCQQTKLLLRFFNKVTKPWLIWRALSQSRSDAYLTMYKGREINSETSLSDVSHELIIRSQVIKLFVNSKYSVCVPESMTF